jgi:GNAT superfamily N-acetyltransferase
MLDNITLRELTSAEMPSIWPLIKQLNPHLQQEEFAQRLREMLASNYRCLGAFAGDKLVAICGFWFGCQFWCGRHMALDNFVVDEHIRSGGLGAKMLLWLENMARTEKVDTIGMDSYTVAHDAHRFYFRHGYFIKGYHFIKPLIIAN